MTQAAPASEFHCGNTREKRAQRGVYTEPKPNVLKSKWIIWNCYHSICPAFSTSTTLLHKTHWTYMIACLQAWKHLHTDLHTCTCSIYICTHTQPVHTCNNYVHTCMHNTYWSCMNLCIYISVWTKSFTGWGSLETFVKILPPAHLKGGVRWFRCLWMSSPSLPEVTNSWGL